MPLGVKSERCVFFVVVVFIYFMHWLGLLSRTKKHFASCVARWTWDEFELDREYRKLLMWLSELYAYRKSKTYILFYIYAYIRDCQTMYGNCVRFRSIVRYILMVMEMYEWTVSVYATPLSAIVYRQYKIGLRNTTIEV